MAAVQRLTSVARGFLWMCRAGGLRARIDMLDRHVDTVDRRLVEAGPDAAARAEAVAAALRGLTESQQAQLRDVEARLTAIADRRLDAEIRARLAEAWRRAGDLRGFERKIYSQNGEDGILLEVFQRIGTRHRFFVEFGVQSGAECNCAYLARELGWGGLFLECDGADFEKLQERYRDRPSVRCARAMVTSKNIEALLEEHRVLEDFDLLSIDIDGNDYWVWQAVRRWRPRVVVIEFNPFHLPPKRWVMKEADAYRWDRSTYFGASLASLTALAHQKGYELVATDSHGVNAFFVLKECMTPGLFLDPLLHYHFSPFTYHPAPPNGSGPFVEV
jgi:hypothetical protein